MFGKDDAWRAFFECFPAGTLCGSKKIFLTENMHNKVHIKKQKKRNLLEKLPLSRVVLVKLVQLVACVWHKMEQMLRFAVEI